MVTDVEYALLAGCAYYDTRDEINRFPVPEGWQAMRHETKPSGFEAIAFQRGDEIVISFAGTAQLADWMTNVQLATGAGNGQLLDAAVYYLEIRNAYPDAQITFTGHSLGGGLAALMGVLFDERAVTFDPAPFRQSANNDRRDVLLNDLAGLGYTQGEAIDALSAFTSSMPASQPSEGGIRGEEGVQVISVAGEAVSESLLLAPFRPPLGVQAPPLEHGGTDVSGVDLHSQALLAAFVQSDSFRQVTSRLPDLLRMVFDTSLYYNDPNKLVNPVRNLLEHLIRHQVGLRDPETGTVTVSADAMLTRFTADLWRLAQDGGLTLRDGNPGNAELNEVSETLIAFAMQKYYEEQAASAGYNRELFAELAAAGAGSNGIRFDMADVSETFQAAFDNGQALDLRQARGFDQYFSNYLRQDAVFSTEERRLIQSQLPSLRDWYVQAGAAGMTATDSLNRGAFMLGGIGADRLTGGTGADLLVGNAGDDTLAGNMGNDTLLGGLGNDTYQYTTGDGLDTVLDRDGQGSIIYDGAALAGGAQYGDARVHRDAGSHLYVDAGQGRLIIDGSLLIEDQQAGELGLDMTGAVADTNPQTSRDIFGDLVPVEPEARDDLDNLATTGAPAPGRADNLSDSADNDHIVAGGGNDWIYAWRGGDDVIETGAGRDYVYGFDGNDVIMGGAEGDILWGGQGDDRIYADGQIGAASAIALGNSQSGSGLQGDWLAGGSGEDTLVGGAGNDVLMGGDGADLLIGGAGDDDILGDVDWVARTLDWSVTDQPDGTRLFYGVENEELPTAGAADVIYAGEGDDHAWGGYGNDVVFGEGGADKLAGNSGSDVLFGGAGNDVLLGDTRDSEHPAIPFVPGNDYLDGGAGEDELYGNEGDDILLGGTGDDWLEGGAGRDTYIINRGDGSDTLIDTLSDNNILRFGAGVSASDITLRLGSLMLDLGNGDAVHIEGFNPDDVFNSSSINSFEFADGTVLTSNELLARGFDIDGTGEADILIGTNTTDRIDGMDGDDQLFGGDGNDIMLGGTGNDTLLGDEGNDVLDGGAGNDHLQGGAGDDALDGGDGADALLGEAGNDILLGGAGNDELQGNAGDDDLGGGSGDDVLFGQEGGDVLHGGAGDDVLVGGAADDVYLFNPGDGRDVIWEEGDSAGDVLRFGEGIAPADLVVAQVGYDLVLSHANGTDEVTIANWYADAAWQLSRIEFADGTLWSGSDTGDLGQRNLRGTAGNDAIYGGALDETLQGLEGNDQLYGNGGNDLLDGGQGNDALTGGSGSDTYLFELGGGADVIGADSEDTLRFGPGISSADIAAERVGADLVLRHMNGTDSVTIRDWFNDVSKQVETIVFSGSGATLTAAQITAPLLTLTGSAGNDTIQGGNAYGETLLGLAGNDVLQGGGGDDSLTGGAGNDSLYGGDGADTYRFEQGDGQDTLYDTSYDNTLVFGPGLAAQLSVSGGYGQDTVYSFGSGADSVRVRAGSTVTPLFEINGTAAADSLNGTAYGDIVHGLEGNDAIDGNEKADTLHGGAGNDTIAGGSGSDWLYGGDGDDVLDGSELAGASDIDTYGSDSRDYYVGGRGNDTLNGNSWEDYYYFNLGDGNDVIAEGTFFANGQWFYSWYDRLTFGPGISPETIQVSKAGNDLVVQVSASDSVTVRDYWTSYKYEVDEFCFDDGRILRREEIVRLAFTQHGTAGNDVLTGDAAWGDVLYGEAGNDTLTGQGGNDQLHGGTGDDWLDGGAGDDEYFFERGGGHDAIVDAGGSDRVRFDASISAADFTLSRNGNDLVLTLAGSGDTLTVRGYLSDPAARIEEFVFADGSQLPSTEAILDALLNIRGTDADDVLIGTPWAEGLYGGAGNDELRGMDGNDTLYGERGDDTLDGGAGSDWLHGGEGNDRYVLAAGGLSDIVVDEGGDDDRVVAAEGILPRDLRFANSGTGLDLLLAGGGGLYLSDQLAAGGGTVERLVFADGRSIGLRDVQFSSGGSLNGTTDDSILVGNSGNNALNGGAGNDWLDGGAGNDSMAGGAGDDIYFVDSRKDGVAELANEGTDLVCSSITYTLGSNVENLQLSGTARINGTGNALDNALAGNGASNTLTGNAGSDRLDGMGGADKMLGGAGDDTYVVDNVGDTVTEKASQGIDTVESSITWTLGANLENLTLTGAAAIGGTGNALNNVLKGNGAANSLSGAAGNDTLDGLGGDDTLTGGAGNDTYILGRGYGTDTVVEHDASAGNTDVAQFLAGVTADQLWFRQAGNDLEISVIGTTDMLVVKDWYLGTAYHVEQFKTTDGANTLIDSDVQNLVSAMATFSPPVAGQTTLPPDYQTALAPVLAASWQ